MDYLSGHGIENPRVLGSIPRLPTSILDGSQRWGPFSFGGTVTKRANLVCRPLKRQLHPSIRPCGRLFEPGLG